MELQERFARALSTGDAVLRDRALAPLIRASPLLFAQLCLKGPAFAPFNGRLLFNAAHYEWEQAIVSQKKFSITAARGTGKCMAAGSKILNTRGERVNIEDWRGGEVWAMDPTSLKLVPAMASPVFKNGFRNILRITTRTGRTTVVTGNHLFRTADEWVFAKTIKPGQRIATPRQYPSMGKTTVPDAYILGVVTGNGGCTGANVVVTTSDEKVVSRLKRDAGRMNWELAPAGLYGYRFCGKKRWTVPGPLVWARNNGLTCLSQDKRVPPRIFSANKKSLLDYLAGFIDTDAYVEKSVRDKSKSYIQLELYSTSKDLLLDMQHLLIRVGCVSCLKAKLGQYKNKDHWSWRLSVGSDSLRRLARELEVTGKRSEVLCRIRKQLGDGPNFGNSIIDAIPADVKKWCTRSQNWHRENSGTRFSARSDHSRKKTLKIGTSENNNKIKTIAKAQILWDQVVSVELLGRAQTYGITVPGFENYMADDVVQHNSFVGTFVHALWFAATHPGGLFYIFSGTDYAAQRMLEDIRVEIEQNPKLRWLYPEGKGKWTATQIRLSNGSQIGAKGMLTRTRGIHPDRISVDDGQTDEDMWSVTKRQKTMDFMFGTITNMLLPHGVLGNLGTPMASDDMMSSLNDNPAYWSRTYPSLDENNQSTWPEVYSTEFLLNLEKEIGSVRFARERRCKPVSDESSLFPRSLFMQGDIMQPQAKLGAPEDFWRSVGVQKFYIGVDFALSTSVSADYFVVTVLGLDENRNHWIIDIDRGRGLSFSEQKARIVSMARRYPPVTLILESNAYQAVAANELKRLTDLPIRKFTTTAQKHSLTDGLPALRILLENCKYRIPRGDKRSVEMTDLLIDEASNFTWAKGKAQSIGSHDDTIMSVYLCEQGIKQGTRVVVADSDFTDTAPSGHTNRAEALVQHLAEQHQSHAASPRAIVSSPESAQAVSGYLVCRNGVYVRT